METGFLSKDKINDFLAELGKSRAVYAPAMEGSVVLFREFRQGMEICLDRPANAGPKDVIFPQCENLLSFKYIKDEADPKKSNVEVKSDTGYRETVIFGCRPCDAKGFVVYDRVFLETDPYYREHREKTVIISKSCEAPFARCFCTATGGGPADTSGSDVLMTEVDNGYFLEAVSDKGKEILKLSMIQDGAAYKEKAQKINKDAFGKVNNPFGKNASEKISKELFELDEFWSRVTDKCVSCGACTYLCPTCYCFNITDEQRRHNGERIRTWDACMFNHFTLEASSHNPRPLKSKRYKNRVGHKFSYYPEVHGGAIACVGCGRCIRFCPSGVDISEIAGYLKDPGQKPENWK